MFFNGTSDFVDLGSSGAIAAATATFSAACYFKREKTTGLTAMVGDNNNAAQNHWNFQVNGPGRSLLTTIITSTGSKALVGTSGVPMNTWCHAVLTYDGATITWYFNGLFDNSTTHTGTVLASTSGVLIGSGSAPIGGAFRYFGGNIAEVKYWDRAISSKEKELLFFDDYNDAGMRTNLAGEWLLNGTANDTAGGNNGTVINYLILLLLSLFKVISYLLIGKSTWQKILTKYIG